VGNVQPAINAAMLPASAVSPRLQRTAGPWLVFAVDGPGLALDGSNQAEVLTVASGPDFLRVLTELAPRVVIVSTPPAETPELLITVAERRHRAGLRAVFVNEPGDIDGRLHALELGFDDALPSSVSPDELRGRALLLMNRVQLPEPSRALPVTPEVDLDPLAHRVRRAGANVHVRPKEYAILALLATNPGRVFSRSELIAQVWGTAHRGDPRTIDVHIRWLRSKIEPDPARPSHLVTVRGAGYRLDPPEP
jgi:two-component system response regulator RegX3